MADQLADLGKLATGIVVVALALVVSFLVMSQGKEQVMDFTEDVLYINSSTSITVDSFSVIPVCVHDTTMSVIAVFNGTVQPVPLINAGNYTVVGNTINISDNGLDASVAAIGSTVNITYSCSPRDAAYNATSTLQNATQTIPGWVPLIVIAVIGAMLLGLVALFRRN